MAPLRMQTTKRKSRSRNVIRHSGPGEHSGHGAFPTKTAASFQRLQHSRLVPLIGRYKSATISGIGSACCALEQHRTAHHGKEPRDANRAPIRRALSRIRGPRIARRNHSKPSTRHGQDAIRILREQVDCTEKTNGRHVDDSVAAQTLGASQPGEDAHAPLHGRGEPQAWPKYAGTSLGAVETPRKIVLINNATRRTLAICTTGAQGATARASGRTCGSTCDSSTTASPNM